MNIKIVRILIFLVMIYGVVNYHQGSKMVSLVNDGIGIITSVYDSFSSASDSNSNTTDNSQEINNKNNRINYNYENNSNNTNITVYINFGL